MSTQRKLNELLYLNLQLFDGEASLPKRVFVQLRDEDGVLVKAQFEIFHVGGGEFRESTPTEQMPDAEMLTASYFVYDNDGVTLDPSYGVAKDVYMRDFSAEIIDTNLDVRVSTVSGGSSGSIAAQVLEGQVGTDDLLVASVNDELLLTATVNESEILEGIIQEDEYVS